MKQSYRATYDNLLLFTQFGHEGESDLIRAYPLGMPFYLLPDRNQEKTK